METMTIKEFLWYLSVWVWEHPAIDIVLWAVLVIIIIRAIHIGTYDSDEHNGWGG